MQAPGRSIGSPSDPRPHDPERPAQKARRPARGPVSPVAPRRTAVAAVTRSADHSLPCEAVLLSGASYDQPIRPSHRRCKVYRRCRFSATSPALDTTGRSARVGEVPDTASRARRRRGLRCWQDCVSCAGAHPRLAAAPAKRMPPPAAGQPERGAWRWIAAERPALTSPSACRSPFLSACCRRGPWPRCRRGCQIERESPVQEVVLAEGVGFEPTNESPRWRFSRPLPSTSRPPLRQGKCTTRSRGWPLAARLRYSRRMNALIIGCSDGRVAAQLDALLAAGRRPGRQPAHGARRAAAAHAAGLGAARRARLRARDRRRARRAHHLPGRAPGVRRLRARARRARASTSRSCSSATCGGSRRCWRPRSPASTCAAT